MLKETRTWQEGKTKFSHIRYIERDFYGPKVDLVIKQEEDKTPTVEVMADSYKFEDVTVAEGINATVEKAAKEIFEKYGTHKIQTKFGSILIDSTDTEKEFDDFKKRIVLF